MFNLLAFLFFFLFFAFLVESIYFLKRKLSIGVVEITNQENPQKGNNYILMGGLMVILFIVIASLIFFFSKHNSFPSYYLKTETIPTNVPTQIIPSPTPVQVVYNLPTATPILFSPTPTVFSKISPTKVPIPTKTPIPTIRVTVSPASPSNTPPIGGPATRQGGPDIISPTITATPTTALVIVPKLPIAGSVTQTLIMLLVAISSITAGLIL